MRPRIPGTSAGRATRDTDPEVELALQAAFSLVGMIAALVLLLWPMAGDGPGQGPGAEAEGAAPVASTVASMGSPRLPEWPPECDLTLGGPVPYTLTSMAWSHYCATLASERMWLAVLGVRATDEPGAQRGAQYATSPAAM